MDYNKQRAILRKAVEKHVPSGKIDAAKEALTALNNECVLQLYEVNKL